MHVARCLIAIATLAGAASSAFGVAIETVPVGNAGNLAYQELPGGPGAVEYDYQVGGYEVTNAQYVEFLNSVDPTGVNSLSLFNNNMTTNARGGIIRDPGAGSGLKYSVKSGREQNPVVYVSWYDAARFTNWLHNGQGSGDTESGAYTLLGGTPTPSNTAAISRNVGAKWWLPSSNEFYKAANHKNDGLTANYWDYPFSSDQIPTSDQPPGNDAPLPSNTANYLRTDSQANGYNDGYAVTGSTTLSSAQNYLTDVGAYVNSKSPYGTYDLGGNVWEWHGEVRTGFAAREGGAWSSTVVGRDATRNGGLSAFQESPDTGFRVAAPPKPTDAPTRFAYDFDSFVDYFNEFEPRPVFTSSGFDSWNASSNFYAQSSSGGITPTRMMKNGVEFQLDAYRPDGNGFATPQLGSRDRYLNPADDLLRDFVYAEGFRDNFLYLTISGLSVGTYRMTSWHFDSDFRGGIAGSYMQIEVGDQLSGAIAAATTVVVDDFRLSTMPQVFEFDVTSADAIKEIVFRAVRPSTGPSLTGFRVRLNGFTLVKVPEPSIAASLLAAIALVHTAVRPRRSP